MGKTHETSKQAKKQPIMTPKEKKAAKREKKHSTEHPPFVASH